MRELITPGLCSHKRVDVRGRSQDTPGQISPKAKPILAYVANRIAGDEVEPDANEVVRAQIFEEAVDNLTWGTTKMLQVHMVGDLPLPWKYRDQRERQREGCYTVADAADCVESQASYMRLYTDLDSDKNATIPHMAADGL